MTDYAKIQQEVLSAGEGHGSRVDTGFFPLDYMPDLESNLDKAAVDARTKIDLLKSYIDGVSEAESSARKDSFLTKQAHYADLIWLLAELNGTIAAWGEDQFHVSMTKGRLQYIVKELKCKIEKT